MATRKALPDELEFMPTNASSEAEHERTLTPDETLQRQRKLGALCWAAVTRPENLLLCRSTGRERQCAESRQCANPRTR